MGDTISQCVPSEVTSDNNGAQSVWVVAVAAPPLHLLPLSKALSLIRSSANINIHQTMNQSSSSQRVTLLLPWVEDRNERSLLYGESTRFNDGALGREQQTEYIRRWSVENSGLPKDMVNRHLRIRFYPAKYALPSRNMKSICKFLPKATTLPVSYEVLQKLKEEDGDDIVFDNDIKLLCVDFQGQEKMYLLRDVLRTSTVNETVEKTSSVSVQSKAATASLMETQPSESKDDDGIKQQQTTSVTVENTSSVSVQSKAATASLMESQPSESKDNDGTKQQISIFATVENTSSVSVQSKAATASLMESQPSESKDNDGTKQQISTFVTTASEKDTSQTKSLKMTRVEPPLDNKLEKLDKDPNYKKAQALKRRRQSPSSAISLAHVKKEMLISHEKLGPGSFSESFSRFFFAVIKLVFFALGVVLLWFILIDSHYIPGLNGPIYGEKCTVFDQYTTQLEYA